MNDNRAGNGAQHELKPDPARWFPAVRTTLDEQIALAERLERICDRQSTLLGEGNFEMAAEVLADRQPLVDRMSELAAGLEPVAGRIGEMAIDLSTYDRGALIERVGRLQGLLDTINQRDEEHRVAFERQRRELGVQIAGLDRGKQATQSYSGGEEAGPSFQDREA